MIRTYAAGAALAVAASLAVSTPALAHPFTTVSSCAFASVNDPTKDAVLLGDPAVNTGVLVPAIAAADTPDVPAGTWHYGGNPVDVFMRCEVYVNGQPTGAAASAAGVVWATAPFQVTYVAAAGDVVEICGLALATDSDGNQETRSWCDLAIEMETPPPVVSDLMCLVAYEVRRLDEALCGPDRVHALPGYVRTSDLPG